MLGERCFIHCKRGHNSPGMYFVLHRWKVSQYRQVSEPRHATCFRLIFSPCTPLCTPPPPHPRIFCYYFRIIFQPESIKFITRAIFIFVTYSILPSLFVVFGAATFLSRIRVTLLPPSPPLFFSFYRCIPGRFNAARMRLGKHVS